MIADTPPPIAVGTRMGPYEILGWIGEGGMGEVYRARDPRLARDVAIKVIRRSFATDADRVRRFEQEARAAGQLNHPNILAVYDSGVHDGTPYIVSELLEGESLRDRGKGIALPWRKAVAVARQIADGLGAAHAKGIVHRDLKPDNLFMTSDGRIKILDFGIAKLLQPIGNAKAHDGRPADTETGTVVGTTGYMSPEQVRGEDVDARSDIFTAGAILYEMLSGRAAFTRGSSAETTAAILKEDPPQPPGTSLPPELEHIVSRCLEKTREARFQSASDLAFALANLPESSTGGIAGTRRLRLLAPYWVASAALVVALALLASMWAPWRRVPPPPLRLAVELSPGLSINGLDAQFGDGAVLSPDGTTIAFVAQQSEEKPPQIYVRRLDQLGAQPLSGSDNAHSLFFSPDSQWIGFFAGPKLKKIAVTGGAAETLADAPELRGASWADNDTIVFAPDKRPGTRLLRVATSSGGTAAPVTELAEGEQIQQWPQVLPGGKAVLFTSSGTTGMYNSADLAVQPLPAGPRRVVLRGGYHGRYLPSGHLVYIHDGTLFAAPFDLDRLEVTGPPVAAIAGMRSNSITGGAQFSVSADGTLLYLPGPSVGAGIPIQWMDARGNTTSLRPALSNWANPTFSPDGERLVMDIREAPAGIWVYELAQDKLTPVTTGPGDNIKAVWSPDGRAIAFASNRGSKSTPNLYWQNADGTGEAHRLTESDHPQRPGSWHPSGKFLAFDEVTGLHHTVMILPLEGDVVSGLKAGTPRPFLDSGTMGSEPVFSPDGRWLAYSSQESGRAEVYVQPFPGPGPKTRVSTEGGFTPTWSRTSHELFYGFVDGRIMVATYRESAGTFVVEKPRLWSEGRYQTRGPERMFDLHPDGTRFALAPVSQSPNVARPDKAILVFNFFDELRRIAPASR